MTVTKHATKNGGENRRMGEQVGTQSTTGRLTRKTRKQLRDMRIKRMAKTTMKMMVVNMRMTMTMRTI
jgi:hypothetical protein